jgi:L-ascorbate metabolism protein UlaG (beta-lactamase superfamily)
MVLQYVGHATVVVALDGVRLMTDPLLRPRVGHLRRAVPVDRDALRDIDAALISHAHYDHLDLRSLRLLGRSALVVVPRGTGALVRAGGFERVVEIDEGGEVDVSGVSVRATHAHHEGGRPFRRIDAVAVGYAILGSRRVYFAGDTDLFPDMKGLVPDLDLALVPIWGWGPTLGRGKHLDPLRAVEALALLRPRVAVPIHWGTYHPATHGLRRPPHFLSEPAEQFARAAHERIPEVDVRVLQPGEVLTLEALR